MRALEGLYANRAVDVSTQADLQLRLESLGCQRREVEVVGDASCEDASEVVDRGESIETSGGCDSDAKHRELSQVQGRHGRLGERSGPG